MPPSKLDETYRDPATGEMAASATGLLEAGTMVQGLQVHSLLGRGGMGEVYKAFDTQLQRYVAIKMVAASVANDAQFAARFRREAQTASALKHPNVGQIYSAGDYAGRPFYVMEYIEGHSLAEVLLEHGPLAGRRCLLYLIQAAQGLRAAHRAGIVHRDVKPANMMLAPDGQLKIVDFGLARHVEMDSTLTQSNVVMGTPAYVAPEQALGAEVDHRADIYALGASFYHLFCGELPFEADTPLGLLMKHAQDPLPPLKERNPRVPQAVCDVIERMLAKAPVQRYADYDELLTDLHAVRQGSAPVSAPTVSRPHSVPIGTAARPTSPWNQPMLWVAAGLLFVFGVALLVPGRSGSSGDEAPAGAGTVGAGAPADPAPAGRAVTGRASRADDDGWLSPPGETTAAGPADPLDPAAELSWQRTPEGGAWEEEQPAFDGTTDSEESLVERRKRQRAQRPAPPPPPAGRSTPLPAGGPANLLNRAWNAQAMAKMRHLSTMIQVYIAQTGHPPQSLGHLEREVGLQPSDLLDAWEHRMRVEFKGELARVTSAGADGTFGTADDLVLEDGNLVSGNL